MAATKENVEEFVLILMLGAESYIKGLKKGSERKQLVMDTFYGWLPDAITKLFPQEMVSALIEKLMTKLKEKLTEDVEA